MAADGVFAHTTSYAIRVTITTRLSRSVSVLYVLFHLKPSILAILLAVVQSDAGNSLRSPIFMGSNSPVIVFFFAIFSVI